MPLYKGTSEITGGNLHKGSTEVEDGYKGTSLFYENQTTISWATPIGQGYTYSVPNPQTSTGDAGQVLPTTTLTITDPSFNLQGTATVSGLPPGITVSNQTNSGGGLGNTITITLTGTYPPNSYTNIVLNITGLTASTNYNAHFLMIGGGGTNYGAGAGGLRTSWGSTSGRGSAAESQLSLEAGTTYSITVANSSTAESFSYQGTTYYALKGGNASIIGGSINKSVEGGANGRSDTPDPFSFANRRTANGADGGCGGGGRTYSGNLSYVYATGGSGVANEGFDGGNVNGGRNASGFAGGGGTASVGGSTPTQFQSNNQTGASGTALAVSITGSTYYYGSGWGTGQLYSNNYGSAQGGTNAVGNKGVVILRVPTSNLGTPSGAYTSFTSGSDTIVRWTGNGSYSA
jgi:hypothetical protein